MDLKLEYQDGILMAVGAGPTTLHDAFESLKTILDTAGQKGAQKILFDMLAVTTVLSLTDRYDLSAALVKYSEEKQLFFKIAVVGEPPVMTGFGVQFYSSRVGNAKAFGQRQEALTWLNAVSAAQA